MGNNDAIVIPPGRDRIDWEIEFGTVMKRLHQSLTIDGVKVQEAKAGDMIHNLWELIEYGSSIITLFPG